MFAPKDAKPRTEAATTSTSNLLRLGSAFLTHRVGHASIEPALSLQPTIGNPLTLRLLGQRASRSGNQPGVDNERKPVSDTVLQAPHGVAWNLSKIPLFPPDRTNQLQASSASAAPSQTDIIQPKIAVGPVDDPLEREADRLADQVMRVPDAGVSASAASLQISRKCVACEEQEKTQNLQTKAVTPHQARAQAPGLVHEVLRSPGQPLNPVTRAFMEHRFGHDFRAIRVHTDAKAMRSARAVNALAFTVGHHIVFAGDQYTPGTDTGKRLLAHELAHTIQQEGFQHANAQAPKQNVSLLPEAMRSVSRPALTLQRACDQPESFYQTSPRFCRDDTFSPTTHPGKKCYREIIQSFFGCPPGDHCCFAPDGTVEDSRDVTSLASSKDDSDGSCGWRWSCIARHTLTDYLPAVVGQALSPLTCAAQCVHSGAPEQCTASCVQQAQTQ
jgi:Domain of unknown function (DUF4157)